MGRTTQYIGLNKTAEEAVDGLTRLPSDTCVTGMFGEKIPLGRWRGWESRGIVCLREVVQEDPWCSGPMIFTCLEADYGKGVRVRCAEWAHDPLMESGAYDYGTGKMAIMSLEGDDIVDDFISLLADCGVEKWTDVPVEAYRLGTLPLWVRREVYSFDTPTTHREVVDSAAECILCALALGRLGEVEGITERERAKKVLLGRIGRGGGSP